MKKLLFSLFLSLLALCVSPVVKADGPAATGKISGKVIDKSNNEALIGLAVAVQGSSTASPTNIEGHYELRLSPGKYNIVYKYIGYVTKTIAEVEVRAGQVTELNVVMEDASVQTKEAVVTASYRQESIAALYSIQKNNISVSDGISADLIKKTPDKNSSDILKRISGASIQENRFAIIRGMNDRYNAALLNGSPLPSTESDRKAFSFDIFPSSVIESMVISKTATPELPGDFGGGVIAIATKEIPDSKVAAVSLSSGFNSITIDKPFQAYHGGKTDYLGIDDGTRTLPNALPTPDQYKSLTLNDPQKASYSKMFNGDMSLNTKQMPVNTGLQVSLGNSYKIFNRSFGAIFSFTYGNSYKYSECNRRGFGGNNELVSMFTDKIYTRNNLLGGMANFSYALSNKNKISFKNLYSINSDNQLVDRQGMSGLTDDLYPNLTKVYNMYFNSNRLYSNQLEGKHVLGKDANSKLKLTWNANYSDVHRVMPDNRTITYNKGTNPDPDEDPETPSPVYRYSTGIASYGADPKNNGRFFSDLREKIYSGKSDLSIPFFSIGKVKNELKVGASYQYRTREFAGRKFGYVNRAKNRESLNTLSIDKIFQTNNIDTNKFLLEEITNNDDKYSAASKLNAAFVMMETHIATYLRFVYGLRVEDFTQTLNSLDNGGSPIVVNTKKIDYLPSMNFTYSLTEKANLRAGISKTLNRPEFRELAPFGFYDFNTLALIRGNSLLTPASIWNYDLRYEYYPSSNQLVSASVFYKNITNPIEFAFDATSGGDSRTYTYNNAKSAINKGVEVEFRKNFEFIGKAIGAPFLKDVVLFANTAWIKSEVSFIEGSTSTTGTKRALQGQSPYLFNSGIQYDNTEKGWSVGALVNKVGRRIVYAGNIYTPDVYENPRTVIDANITKTIKKRLELKLTIGDLLAQRLTFYEDRNNSQKLERPIDATALAKASDNIIFDYKTGRTISFRIGYKF